MNLIGLIKMFPYLIFQMRVWVHIKSPSIDYQCFGFWCLISCDFLATCFSFSAISWKVLKPIPLFLRSWSFERLQGYIYSLCQCLANITIDSCAGLLWEHGNTTMYLGSKTDISLAAVRPLWARYFLYACRAITLQQHSINAV